MNENSPQAPVVDYWNLREQQRQALHEAHLIGEDEYQVLMMINAGRQIVSAQREQTPGGLFPTMMQPDILRVEECLFYDAIAQLLAAAMKEGYGVMTIMAAALDQLDTFVGGARTHAATNRG
ncbi:hypothetical protein [Nocardioides euryhalodurans]|uniref:Uncharacterized protein n=1 Tax=Nocardioides euryhalodurans TaxID=2518370 RepID=A0A4P7GMA4_9ACTN|nr:hypothetical protein [Nocardioides euryhalodurans]QBR93288.1 hypothetical protein EXE57_14215 [Nocardioides euryhalodurans]